MSNPDQYPLQSYLRTIVIDMNRIYEVTAITYMARTDGNANGMVKAYI